ncbi:MAG: hydrogenase formation protein HypD, partial [Planctomycetes bacterium]|nr:hydrogenase formation protein HypD [Planctomycetota bacterium]
GGSLLQAKTAGADVRMVYSPLDALQLAKAHPDRQVVFFALGFETTMPSTALTVLRAQREGVTNFSLFCNHITIIPTLQAILEDPGLQIDGFLGPGHVSMVIGNAPYRFIAERYQRPLVVTGFEPLDILHALWMVLKQLAEGRAAIENQYNRVVAETGNAVALAAIDQVFELREFFEWRGLGSIPHSGVRMREEFAAFDAERRFTVPALTIADPQACQCGAVLKGQLKPWDCQVFGTDCTPETPLGALMVSSEGACAAYYQYGNLERRSSATTTTSAAP